MKKIFTEKKKLAEKFKVKVASNKDLNPKRAVKSILIY